MNKYLIYGLYCPFTNKLHYIGKSSSYMIRPLQHLNDSHSEKINEWVQQLKFLNHKPIVKILEECTEENFNEKEKEWIKKSNEENCYLLNVAHNYVDKVISQKEYEVEDVDMLLIGKTIKEVRINAELTQEKLSEMAGIDRSTLRRIERGNKQITIKNLKCVLNVFGFEMIIRKKQNNGKTTNIVS
jgi:DNA-binding XRE family transcriptional regulator